MEIMENIPREGTVESERSHGNKQNSDLQLRKMGLERVRSEWWQKQGSRNEHAGLRTSRTTLAAILALL